MSDEQSKQLFPVLQERYKCPHFRILVVGRANAGKTTILQKVCNVDHKTKPIVYDRHGKKMRKVDTWWSRVKSRTTRPLRPSQGRGEHNIQHQITYPGCNFIFHDSRGFESGSQREMDIVTQFLEDRSTNAVDMKSRLHAIWYCIPMDDARVIADAELDFFQHRTGDVPVIVVFTKFDALIVQEYNKILDDVDEDEKWDQANINANDIFQKVYVPRLENTSHPPQRIVHLQDMDRPDQQCPELTEKTAEVINDSSLRQLFISVQKNNINLCVKEAIK